MQLREWVVTFPAYWTPEQAQGYMKDTSAAINNLMVPCMMALGPVHAAAMMLAVVASIVRGNPVYAHDIQGAMANTYDLVSQIKTAMEPQGKPN